MDHQKTFKLIFVVVLGVFAGVVIAVQQAKFPVLKRLMQQQDAILKTQKQIRNNLAESGNKLAPLPSEIDQDLGLGDTKNILRNQDVLEKRIQVLEMRLSQMQDMFKKMADMQKNMMPPQPPKENYNKKYTIQFDHSPVVGKKDAPITLVEFVDFECPFSAKFFPLVKETLKAYPDKVNFIVKNFPLNFHPQAKPASKAALAANEQGKYMEMVSAILKDNKGLNEEKFNTLAKEIGLDMDKFAKDLKEKDAQWEELIKKDMALGGKVDVRGTPTFYLNGKKTRSRNFESLKKEIDAILNKK